VLPESPAADAGLKEGMLIASVDDVATRGKPLIDCVAVIRGPAGTTVRLVVLDPATLQPKTVVLVRRKVKT
jgi:carboxyl-terminal processing protease